MKDVIQILFYIDIFGDIVLDKFEIGIIQKMGNILFFTGNQVIHTDNPKMLLEQSLTEVRTDKTCPAGNKNLFHFSFLRK